MLPELHLADWRPTKDTLHLYAQILGKIRLATTAPRNHWWNVPLYVDVRGLTGTLAIVAPKIAGLMFNLVWNYTLYSKLVFRQKESQH